MLSSILILYFFGLSILIFSCWTGFFVLKFKSDLVFKSTFLGFLSLISCYAIFKSNFNSIAIFTIIWILGYTFFINKNEETHKFNNIGFSNKIIVISVLWTLIFLFKLSLFWNFDYNCPNLLFVDYEFYMKIAEGYNLTGNENAMGLKNAILPVLDFAQPYRSNDIWLVSLGLDLTKIDTIYIWELFYGPILLTICSLSLFEIIKKKNNFYFSITFSFLCLFAFAGNWYRNLINLLYPINEGGLDPIGIVTYLKLAIVFTLLFQFFDNYVNQRKIEALYFLILIPLLVQSTIAIFIIVFILISALIFKEYKKSKFNNFKHFIPFISLFLIISLGFVLFYKINQYSEFQIIGATTLNISSNENFLELLIQFFKKSVLLLLSYFWLSIIIAGILIFSNSNFTRKLKIELFLILIVTYFSTILVYAQFNKVGDAYQFSTNIFGPFVLSFIIFLLLKKSNKIQFKYLNIFILFLISGLGFYQICSESNFFQTDKRINFYSKNFINEVKLVLPKVKNPFGIIYYGDNLQNNPREDFPLMDASFLKLFGRNYEVFNIEGNGLKMNLKDKNLQKNNLYIQKNAINIWIKNQSKKTKQNLNSIDFYKHFQFGFCISRITIDKLPAYIKRDITKIIKDDNSKIFFYKLR